MPEPHATRTHRRLPALPFRLLGVGLLFAGLVCVSSAQAQEQTPLARVEALDLETAEVGRVTAHFAPADRERALEVATLAEGAAAFFERELGLSFDFGVAALSPADWFSQHPGVPYAIPWLSISQRLIFVPSSLSEGLMVRGPTTLHDRRRVDFVLLHEYGHLAEKAYLRPESARSELPIQWFGELVANVLAYAYVSTSDPEWAEAGKEMWRDVVEGYAPPVLSLDWGFMNDLPPEELARTYAWYQNMLNLRAAALYETHGLDFVRSLKDGLAWDDTAEWTTASLLQSLEEIAPGFEAWADDLQTVDHLPQASTPHPASPESTRETLLRINREVLEPMILENDPSGLLAHAHEDFLVIAPGGVVEDREQASSGVKAFSATGISISDEQVTLVGDTAIVIGKLEIDGEMRPVGELPPMKFLAVFVQQDAEWKLLARSLTACFPLAIEHGLC